MDAIVIKKSELIEQIREDFKLWEKCHRISTKAILTKRTYSLI